jgi:hypothetical protein
MKLFQGGTMGETEVLPDAIYCSMEMEYSDAHRGPHALSARILGRCTLRALIIPIPLPLRDVRPQDPVGDYWTVGWHFVRFVYVRYDFQQPRFWHYLIPWRVKRVYAHARAYKSN